MMLDTNILFETASFYSRGYHTEKGVGTVSWVQQMAARLGEVEKEAVKSLGEDKAGFFVSAWNDCFDITSTIHAVFPNDHNLLTITTAGVLKELGWFHFLFVSGNYPLLLGRLRFVWESIFRAYFAEHYPLSPSQSWAAPSTSPDDKLTWLKQHGRHLNWQSCMEAVLRDIFPLANQDESVRAHYKTRWDELNKYAHPTADLTERHLNSPFSIITDVFDWEWALETIDIAADTFDLMWLAVLVHYPQVFERISGLSDQYPVLSSVLEETNTPSGS